LMDASLGQVIAPHVQTVLNMSPSDRHWLITALPFAMGAALLLGGRAVDYFGARSAFVAGVLGFAVASAAAGLSMTGLQMISCRVVQGICAAILMPAVLAIVSSASSDTGPRAKMFALFGTVAAIGPFAGMMLGGIIMQSFSWRACLFANLFVAAPVAGVAMAVIRPRPARKQAERFNILNALLATAALALIIFGASRVGDGPSIILSSLAAEGKYAVPGIILFAVFIWAERHSRYPLVKLSLLADRTLAFSLLALMVGGGSVLAVVAQLSFYMQNVLHYTPIETGSALLPSSVAMLVGTPLTGFLVPRIGARKTFALGTSLSSLGLFMLLGISAHSNYFVSVFPGILISSLGLGVSNMPGLNVIMSRVHANYAGIIGALSSITSQVGLAFTVTIINSITVASTATSLGVMGGYRMGLAVAAVGCLIGALLVAVFVCARADEGEVMPTAVEAGV
jgi:MFS family permease